MGDSFVNVMVTSNVHSFHSERRFPTTTTIRELKTKLELLTGVPPDAMKLELRTAENKFVAEIGNDSSMLADCNVIQGSIIHVIDTRGVSAEEEAGAVPKFEISDEAYGKRTESVRTWKREMQLGQYNNDAQKEKQDQVQQLENETAAAATNIEIGQRCEVRLSNQPPKRGSVMFVGKTHFKPGHFVGIKYDEPLGKNDGSIDGKRYFECPPKYGAFVRPQDVVTGDFPEDDLENMDEL